MTKSSKTQTRKMGFESWPGSDVPPTFLENVIIVFHGLLAFAYNERTRTCEIAIHGDAPDHDFQINAFELEDFGLASVPVPLYSFTPDSHDQAGGIINLEIESPGTRGVKFFLPDFAPQDFQWQDLVDIESSDFFGDEVEKKPRAHKPKLRIHDGLFCTIPTDAEFLRTVKGASATQDLGKIAYMALATANQDSATSGDVTLTSDLGMVRLRRSPGTTLLLFITNICPQDECDEDVPDFELYYRMFKRPSNAPKYLLEKKQGSPRRRNLGTASQMMSFFERFFAHLLSSQDAPCTEMGFGQSPGGTG